MKSGSNKQGTRPFPSPVILLLLLSTAVFVVEWLFMTTLLDDPYTAFVDAIVVTAIVLCLGYFLMARPLRKAQAALMSSRSHYMDLYEIAPVGYLTLTETGLIAEINLTGGALLGGEPEEMLHRRFTQFVAPADQARWQRHFLDALEHGGKQAYELKLQRRDGTLFDAGLDCLRTTADDTTPALRIALTDIAGRKQAEEKLRIAAAAFESQEGMIVTDPKGRIVRVNQAFTRLTGYSAEEAIGQTPALLHSGHHDKNFYRHMWKTLKETGYWQGEVWNRRKNGKIYVEWLTISAVTAPDGTITHFVGACSDITQNKEAEAEIHRLAYYDPLTDLPNRRLLYSRLGQAMAGSDRSRQYGALLFLDLDDFKTLNDTRGHALGDQLLIETAQRIQANVRASDTVARLGGDEFVVILDDLSADPIEANRQSGVVGGKIRKALDEPYELDGCQIHCPASLGIALFRGHEESVDNLLKHADMAMYQAKNTDSNGLRFFEPAMQISMHERGALKADLRLAVEREEWILHYQAQTDHAGRVTGAEALLRWMHPERGLVMPGDFIPLAEETGLILPIGQWVLETACTQIRLWSAAPETHELLLAVNVSARQFRQPAFVADVQRILTDTGADPTRLKIELTESMVLEDVGDTLEKMYGLKALGIGLALDDFGTGHASLSYLTRLPLDQIKLDRSFVLHLPDDSNSAVIAQTIITMARSLGLDIIAEGVETEAQREFLERCHCQIYQGFLFSRPLPLEGFRRLLAGGQPRCLHDPPPVSQGDDHTHH